MNCALRLLVILLALSVCRASSTAEPADAGAPKRLSDIVRQADYVVLDFGDYGHPQPVKITDKKFIESIARIFAAATFTPCDPSLSVSPALFAFYVEGKLRMAVSLQPGSVMRLSNARAEENFEVSAKSLDALRALYETHRADQPPKPTKQTSASGKI